MRSARDESREANDRVFAFDLVLARRLFKRWGTEPQGGVQMNNVHEVERSVTIGLSYGWKNLSRQQVTVSAYGSRVE